jgi:hypothetical protein
MASEMQINIYKALLRDHDKTPLRHLVKDDQDHVAGTRCKSHIMAPAVYILNPLYTVYSTHIITRRPGGGLRWVRSPLAEHRSTQALAQSFTPGHTRRRKLYHF